MLGLANCLLRNTLLRSTIVPMRYICKKTKIPASLVALKKKQELFQKKDDKPVFLKGGPRDVLLYRATWVLCLIGLALNVKLYLYYLLL